MTTTLFIALLCGATVDSKQAGDSYDVTVCLRFDDAPLLTPAFCDNVQHQVEDYLTNYFGPLANLNVVRREHWVFDELSSRVGNVPLTHAILARHRQSGQLIVVDISHTRHGYRLTSRYANSETNWIGSANSQTTPDRQWLAKAVCLAVKDGFSPVATVTATSPNLVSLHFRGADFNDQLDRVLGKSCFLQPVQVFRQADGKFVQVPMKQSILQYTKGKYTNSARLHSGLDDPWKKSARVVRIEAVKLNTQSGRIRLKIIDNKSGKPAIKCLVYANDKGFKEIGPADSIGSVGPDGVVQSRRIFQDVAFVRIKQGDTKLELPVPITSDICEQRIEFNPDKAADEKFNILRKLGYLVQDLQALDTIINVCIRDYNKLNEEKKYEDAQTRVNDAIASVQPLYQIAAGDFNDLNQLAEKLGMSGDRRLKYSAQEITRQQDRIKELQNLSAVLNQMITKLDAQSRANELINRAAMLESVGDIDEAITCYEEALEEQPDQPQLTKKLDEIKKLWNNPSPEVAAARKTIYEDWALTAINKIADNLPAAKTAFETLEAEGDYLGAFKLQNINGEHLKELSTFTEILADRGGAADDELDQYTQWTDDLAAFQQDVTSFLRTAVHKNVPAAKPAAPAAGAKPPDEEEEEEPLLK